MALAQKHVAMAPDPESSPLAYFQSLRNQTIILCSLRRADGWSPFSPHRPMHTVFLCMVQYSTVLYSTCTDSVTQNWNATGKVDYVSVDTDLQYCIRVKLAWLYSN